jgi:hypothetical protein
MKNAKQKRAFDSRMSWKVAKRFPKLSQHPVPIHPHHKHPQQLNKSRGQKKNKNEEEPHRDAEQG